MSLLPPDDRIRSPARPVARPVLVSAAGPHAAPRLVPFVTAEVRNPNTRAAYARAVARFDRWCSANPFPLADLTPRHVAAYIEHLGRERSKPSVKPHLAALRMPFDYLVTGHVEPSNPVGPVRRPKYVRQSGNTPVMHRDEVRQVFAAIDTTTAAGLRAPALLGVLVYTFARVRAGLHMDVGDYSRQGKRWWVRLPEKGGKDHAVPVPHTAEGDLDACTAPLE